MNKVFINGLLVCLLTMLPFLSFAQLTRYEYWFDNNYSGVTPVGLSSSETIIDTNIPTDGLKTGFHTLHFRVKQEGGWYSPITSQTFFKIATAVSGKLEYWFDTDFENRVTEDVSAADDEGFTIMNLNLRDYDKFPMGAHRLNLRVSTEDGWTPVYSADVLKLTLGKVEKLQYWFDDDFESVKTIDGIDSNTGIVFTTDLNLSDVSEGMHRLYYRGISGNKQTNTAVNMTPVMVKSRYNTDDKNLKVVQYSVAVDNETPVIYDVLDPQKEIMQPFTLDARQLTDGKHTVEMHFWNSVGAGVSVKQDFQKKKPEPPTLTLTAKEENGKVTLSLNTIPDGLTYRIYREGGYKEADKPIYRGHDTYPSPITCTDTPGEGYQHYYATCAYNDVDGTSVLLKSNRLDALVSVTSDNSGKYGYILAETQYGCHPGSVFFGDKDGNPMEILGLSDEYGMVFQTQKVSVGTEVWIDIYDDSKIEYQKTKVVIKPGRNHVIIPGTPINGAQIDPSECDLVFDSDVEWVPKEYLKFKVRNRTTKPWTGFLRMRAVNKAYETQSLIVKIWETMWTTQNMYIGTAPQIVNLAPGRSTEIKIPLQGFLVDKDEYYKLYFETMEANTVNSIKQVAVNYQHDYSIDSNPWERLIEKTHSGYKNTGEISLEMANLAVALCSKIQDVNNRIGKMGDLADKIKKKKEEKQKEEQFIQSLDIDLYSFEELNVMINNHYRNVQNNNTESKEDAEIKGLSDLINTVLREDPDALQLVEKFRNYLKDELNSQIGDLLNISKYVTDCWGKIGGYLNDVTSAIDKIKEFRSMDPHTRFFHCTRELFDAFAKWNPAANPYAQAVKLYLDIAEVTVNKALAIDKNVYTFEESWLMSHNTQEENDFWKYKNRQIVNFKVVVNKPFVTFMGNGYAHISSFNFKNDTEQIKSAKVMLSNTTEAVDTMLCYPIGEEDGFYLKQYHYANNDALEVGKPLTKLWLELEWKNGRTTVIPLVEDNKGVIFTTVGGPTYVITFNSDSDKMKNIADKIYLVE